MFGSFGGGGASGGNNNNNQAPPTTNLFQTSAPSSGGFGSNNSSSSGPFGAQAQNPFQSSSSPFGSGSGGGSNFGGAGTQSNLFGNTGSSSGSAFGTSGSGGSGSFGAGGGGAASTAFGGGGTNPTFGGSATNSPAFGGKSTGQPTFGGASSQPAFGTQSKPAAFGGAPSNTPLFGGTSSTGTTGTKTGTLFGGTSSAAASTPLFGGITTAQSGFGTGAAKPFGGNTTNSQTFGSNTTSSQPFGGNTASSQPFGGNTTSSQPFGGNTTSSQPFGGNTTSSQPFGGNTTSSQPFGGNTTSSQPFGGNTTNSQPSRENTTSSQPFGGNATSSQPFGESKPLFGANSTTSSGASSTASSILFGGPASRETTAATKPLFGGTASATTTAPLSGSSTTTKPLFGANTSSSTSTASAKPLFGATSSSSSSSSSSSFGVVPSSAQFSANPQPNPPSLSSTTSSNPFGGSSTQQATQQSSSSTTATQQFVQSTKISTTATLFGKTGQEAATKPEPSATSQTLFGGVKPTEGGDGSSQGLFSKQSESQALFHHKPVTKEGEKQSGQDVALFGKSEKQDPGTLFGKSASTTGPDQGADSKGGRRTINIRRTGDGEGGGGPSTEERTGSEGLFGKGAKSTTAASSSSSSHRRASVDQVASKVALKCTRVPPDLNNRAALSKHFNQYGKVTKVYANPAKHSATIHFETHEDAQKAKKYGRNLPDGKVLLILWSTFTSTATKTAGGTRTSRPSGRGSGGGDDVDEELASMSGPLGTDDIRLLRRPGESISSSGRSRVTSRSPSPRPRRDDSPAPAVTPGTAGRLRTLRELGQVVANTASDRYQLLNERDKLIRQALGSGVGSSGVGSVLMGSCEDMCPEKERYMREDRRRLSVYEIVPGTDGTRQNPVVDHARAVKEYSRSSADQDVPLPHELRPGPALQRTMDFLVATVMEQGAAEGQWGDWYEFLWSRTRGIRKDLTQQQLCSLTAVHLVEVCARWHVYSAHRLCAEDMMTFDAKINDENLTKCLQTLKELYHDLAKKGEKCPREAEFRAYLVLMNLNEGDILRETQELREDLRESAEVQFVLQVFYALNSNNYVRFFKLVKRATFLNACIMHRYFNQVRRRALWTMLKAYYMKAKFPLADLVRCMAFEDEEEAQEFCQHHNLPVLDACVVLDKAAFVEPETRLPARRAHKLIEAKQQSQVGVIVNGGSMPVVDLPEPHNSFDEDTGRLKDTSLQLPNRARSEAAAAAGAAERLSAVGSSSGKAAQPPPPPAAIPAVTSPAKDGGAESVQRKEDVVVSNDVVKDIAKDLFLEVIHEQSVEMSTTLVRAAKWYLDQSVRVASELHNTFLPDLIKEVAELSLSEAQAEAAVERQRDEAEKSRSMEVASQSCMEQLLNELIIEQCRDTAKQQYKEVQAVLTQESQQRVSARLADDLLAEVLEQQIGGVATLVYREDVVEKERRLEDTCRAVRTLRLGRYFKRWRDNHAARMRLKGSLHEFPTGPAILSPGDQLLGLLPRARGVRENRMELAASSLTLEAPDTVIEGQERMHYQVAARMLLSHLQHDRAWQPLNIPDLILPPTTRRQHRGKLAEEHEKKYWKLVVSLPGDEDDSDAPESKVLCDWLRSKFRKGSTPNPELEGKTEVLSLYRGQASETTSTASVSVCVRTINGDLSPEDSEMLKEKHCLHALSALCFVVSPLAPEQNLWRRERERLSAVLQACGAPCYPVLILAPACSPHAASLLPQLLATELLQDQGRLNAYTIMEMPEELEYPEASSTLSGGMMWLAEHWPPAPALRPATPIRDYVEAALVEHFYGRVYQDLAARKARGLLHQSPSLLIQVYNELIQHLAEQASSQQLQQLCWPMPELSTQHSDLPCPGWNSPDRLALLQQSILDLSLPEFCYEDVESNSWETALIDIDGYLSAVIEADEDKDGKAPLYSRVALLVERTERGFEAACWESSRLADCVPTYINAPWTDILMACVHHRLDYLHTTDDEQGEDLLVHVLATAPSFQPPADWLEASQITQDTQRTGLPTIQSSVLLATSKRKLEKDDSRRLRKLQKSAPMELLDLEPLNPEQVEAAESRHKLKEALHQESKDSKAYDDYLERVIGAAAGSGDVMNFDDPTATPPSTEDLIFDQLESSVFLQPFASPLTPQFEYKKRRRFRTDSSETNRSAQRQKRQSKDLTEEVSMLNQTLELQKSADRLFEIRLQVLLSESL